MEGRSKCCGLSKVMLEVFVQVFSSEATTLLRLLFPQLSPPTP